jgi:hypothetical protein
VFQLLLAERVNRAVWSGFLATKRMMGLEPTTVCMASGVVGLASVTSKAGWLKRNPDALPRFLTADVSSMVCRQFLAVWALERFLCPFKCQAGLGLVLSLGWAAAPLGFDHSIECVVAGAGRASLDRPR